MTDDLVKRLRSPTEHEAWLWSVPYQAANRIEQLEKNVEDWKRMYREAVIQKEMIFRHQYDHIEKLEAALYEIAHLNNMRDRFSSEIDNVITTVMGEKNANA